MSIIDLDEEISTIAKAFAIYVIATGDYSPCDKLAHAQKVEDLFDSIYVVSREMKNVIDKLVEAHNRKTSEGILAIDGRVDYAYYELLPSLRELSRKVENLKNVFKSESINIKLLREFSIKAASLALSHVATYITQR